MKAARLEANLQALQPKLERARPAYILVDVAVWKKERELLEVSEPSEGCVRRVIDAKVVVEAKAEAV